MIDYIRLNFSRRSTRWLLLCIVEFYARKLIKRFHAIKHLLRQGLAIPEKGEW